MLEHQFRTADPAIVLVEGDLLAAFADAAARLDKAATGKIRKQLYKEPGILTGAWHREAAGAWFPR